MSIRTCFVELAIASLCLGVTTVFAADFKNSPDYMSTVVLKAKVAMLSANKDTCTNENINRLYANLLYHAFANDLDKKQADQMDSKIKKVVDECEKQGLLPTPGFRKKNK